MSLRDFKASVQKNQWKTAIGFIRTNSTLSKKRYPVPTLVGEASAEASEVYPIHHVCSQMDVPLEVVEYVLSSYPGGIHKKESSMQRTCLHLAVLNSLSDDVISFLIDADPDAVRAQDKFGRVPLHYACSKRRSFESIKRIIKPFYQCIQAPDWKLWTPVHVAVTKNTDPEIIEYMLSLCPETLSMTTSNGLTLLDLVMDAQVSENKPKIVDIIVRKDTEFDGLTESQNLRKAAIRPLTPLEMQPYSIV